jgi:hypothetical protein
MDVRELGLEWYGLDSSDSGQKKWRTLETMAMFVCVS